MKYTVTEFAVQIRSLYPGDYDDLTDTALVTLWIKKHPDDIDKIQLNYTNTIIREKESSSYGWIFLVIIFALAFFTNPSPTTHKEKIKEKLNVYLEKGIKNTLGDQNDEWSKLGGIFGTYLGKTALDEMVETTVSSDNYIFFSLTKFSFGGGTNIIGFGVFGNIFLLPQFETEIDKTFKKMFK